MTPNTFIPMVVFYPSNTDVKMFELKNSLSQTLTKYYPFAGRHAKIAPSYVDCNDDGVAFVEASIDSTLLDFFKHSQHEDLDQFFPYGRIWNKNCSGQDLQSDGVVPLAVQVSHFECGGVALALSFSHKIADGSSLVRFLNDWAKMTRFCSSEQKQGFPVDPRFIPFQNINLNFDGISLACSMAAATKNNSGSFKTSGIGLVTNLRSKMMNPLPENTIGNISFMEILMMDEREMKAESFIGELKKQKMQVHGLTNIEDAFGRLQEMGLETSEEEMRRKYEERYICTSLCRYPAYKINFGWGNPIKVTIGGNIKKNSFVLIDAPNDDGIEALVCLVKQDMAVIQTDPELLKFC
ncbi:hypothetical protein OSB04_010041 [Centaurea solstitialis]|uniref:Uncharacterized protein n=1 Tax=Centaurea solstitialis TaxID=347529 RepID=A0AA38WBI2_9ASTR|nr:hypothetical protein OSB04_010041 [Centaurea solstitialis]